MNEMRRDPVTRKWIIIEKGQPVEEVITTLRHAVSRSIEKVHAGPCELCPGNESKNPSTIMELVDGRYIYQRTTPSWRIRVVPDRDPVFRIEGSLNRRLVSGYDVMDALGAHELIIEHREHVDWDALSLQEMIDILGVYQERMNDLSRDERFGHLFIFKNFGPNSSTHIPHPYSTLIASPSVPERIRRELDSTGRHFRMKERCLFCDLINEESRQRNNHSGLIKRYEHFVTISPYFAAHPLETWILPRKHSSNFKNIPTDMLPELARALQENLSRVKKLVGELSYSLMLFTRPNKVWGSDRDYWATIDLDYHWHFKFFPRFPNVPGFRKSFSAGSGYMVNQIPPEQAAALLREQTLE